MITMPQWFLWTGIDSAAIQTRLAAETLTNKFYYAGIFFGLLASIIDICGNFIIRKIGDSVPKSIIPFLSGLISTPLIFIFVSIQEPFDYSYFFSSSEVSVETTGTP